MPGWYVCHQNKEEELVEINVSVLVYIRDVHHVVNTIFVLLVEFSLILRLLELIWSHRSQEVSVAHGPHSIFILLSKVPEYLLRLAMEPDLVLLEALLLLQLKGFFR